MEALLNSPVLTATVTATGAVALTLVTYWLSTKKKLKKYRGRQPEDPTTYAGYEVLLKQYKEEIERLYSVAKDREEVIALLRLKEEELYKRIEQKDQEISWLRHRREFVEAAQEYKKEG